MGIWHFKSKRKPTGGLLSRYRKGKKYDLGNEATKTTIGKRILKKVRTKGGGIKLKLRASETTNVLDPKTKNLKVVNILDVVENRANPHFVRQKVITKGAILKTEIGNVKVTSRPAQEGMINSVLIEEVKEKPKKVVKKKKQK